MNIEFPDNLNSSQSMMPEKQGNGWNKDIKFLHFFPKSNIFGKEQQEITKNIKNIELLYLQKVAEMVTQLQNDEQGTLNIIPKRANIDLKRAIQSKLDKLKKKTDRTIITLLNEKFQTNSKQENQEHQEVQSQIPNISEKLNVYDKEVDFEDDYDIDDDYETL